MLNLLERESELMVCILMHVRSDRDVFNANSKLLASQWLCSYHEFYSDRHCFNCFHNLKTVTNILEKVPLILC